MRLSGRLWPLLPIGGGQLKPDASAERTSVPMETAEVGEGSQAQLVSLQGDKQETQEADKCQGAPISLLAPHL